MYNSIIDLSAHYIVEMDATITQALLAVHLKQELPAHARKGYERLHWSREPSFIIISLSLAAKLLI